MHIEINKLYHKSVTDDVLSYSNTDIYFASAARTMLIKNHADYASSIKKAQNETKNKKYK